MAFFLLHIFFVQCWLLRAQQRVKCMQRTNERARIVCKEENNVGYRFFNRTFSLFKMHSMKLYAKVKSVHMDEKMQKSEVKYFYFLFSCVIFYLLNLCVLNKLKRTLVIPDG